MLFLLLWGLALPIHHALSPLLKLAFPVPVLALMDYVFPIIKLMDLHADKAEVALAIKEFVKEKTHVLESLAPFPWTLALSTTAIKARVLLVPLIIHALVANVSVALVLLSHALHVLVAIAPEVCASTQHLTASRLSVAAVAPLISNTLG